jgi:predicted lipoprotein with Yx(FWY)xxD motif
MFVRGISAAVVIGLLAFGVSEATAGTSVASPAALAASHDPTISLHSSKYGKILVNSRGYTLYLWVKDKRDKSVCNSSCQALWPFVRVSGRPTAGPGVRRNLLGTIRVAGGDDVTYNGHPLYTFVSDTRPGAITGEGNKTFGGPWYVVSAAGNEVK